MRDNRMRISLREVIYVLAALVLFFEIYLMEQFNIFRYMDEFAAVVCLLIILVQAFKKRLDRSQIGMLLLMLLLLGIGLVSNYYSNLQENPVAIITDVGNTFKVFVTYVGATLYLRPVKNKKWIVTSLARVMRLYVLVMFVGLFLHLTGVYPMGNDVRYGIASYEFLNFGAGQLSFMFYTVFTVLTIDMRYDRHNRQIKMMFIILAAIVWASTLRLRALMYVAMFFAFYWLIIVKERRIKMNWKTALVVIVVMLVFSVDQLGVYFGNTGAARYVFMKRGIQTMRTYFPFGAGFSCYGTDAAVKYYAKLYVHFGFQRVWGLSPQYPLFAHDTYWPAIMAQFGAFGLVVMLLIVYRWVRDLLKRTQYNKYAYLVGLFVVLTQVSASIATATFFHFVTLALCFVLPIAFEDNTTKQEIGVSCDESNRLYPNV